MRKIILSLLLLAACAPVLLVGNAQAGAKLWEKKLSGKILWKEFHPAGLMLVITDKELLYALDPKTGNEVYKIEDLSKNVLKPNDEAGTPTILAGTPYFLIATKAGMIKPEILKLVNAADGKIIWEASYTVPPGQAEAITGGKKYDSQLVVVPQMISKVVFDPAHDQIIITSLGGYVKTADNRKIVKKSDMMFVGIDIKTGNTNFVYPSDETFNGSTVIDSDVLISGDVGVVDWNGMRTFSVIDGKELGVVKMKRMMKAGLIGGLPYTKTNAPSVIEGDTVYITVKEHIEAYNINTGAKKWESEDLDVVVPQLLIAGDKLVGKMGGVFCTGYSWKTKVQCKEFRPYGIVVLDKNTGKVLAMTSKLDKQNGKAITSSLAIDNNIVYHAVSNGARAFDLTTLTYKWMTSISKKAEDGDDPKLVQLDDGKMLMLNTQVTAAFNAADGKLLWSQVVPPVEMDLAMKMVMAFASVAAYASGVEAGKNGSINNQQQTIDRWSSTDAQFSNMMKQISIADKKGRYNYSMTGKSKNALIMGVNTKTGKLDRGCQVEGRVPDYLVDQVSGILMNVSKSDPKWLMAYDMGEPLPKMD